jgi:ribosomal protein S27AE
MSHNDRLRICGRCEKIFLSEKGNCPKCGFGSYSATWCFGRFLSLVYLITQTPYRRKKGTEKCLR